MSRKILKFTIILIGFLALFFFSIFYTETMPRLLLEAAESLSECSIEVGKTTGSLSRGFHLETLAIKGDGYCVVLRDIFLRITPMRLLERTLFLDFLAADEVFVNIGKRPKGNGNKQQGTQQILFPDLFFNVNLKDARIKSLLIRTGKDSNPLTIKDLSFSAAIKDRTININFLKGNFLPYRVAFLLEANVSAFSQPAALSGRMVLKRRVKGARQTVLDANFKGDLRRLSLTGKIRGVPEGTFNGLFSDILEKPKWQLVIDLTRINPSFLAPGYPPALIQVNARLHGEEGTVSGLIRGNFSLPHKGKGTFLVKGGYGKEGFQIEKGVISTLGGKLTVSGTLSKDSGFRAKAALDNIHLDPLLPGIKARVSGTVKASGILGGKRGPFANIRLEGVHGRLNGRACAMEGDILLDKARIEVKEIEFQALWTSLSLSGVLKRASQDIKVAFKSKDLSLFYPALKGEVRVKAHVFGKRKDPGVHLYALGKKISYPQGGLKAFKVTLDSDGLLSSQIKARVNANGIFARDIILNTLHASLKGTRSRHLIRLRTRGEGLMADLRLLGGLNRKFHYRGLVKALDLRLEDSGIWKLPRPSRFLAGRDGFDISQLCLKNGKQGGRLCISGEIGKRHMGIDVVSSSLPLRPLSRFLAKRCSLSGTFDLRLSFFKEGMTSKGNFFFKTRDAKAFFEKINKAMPLMLSAKGYLSEKGLRADVLASLDTKTDLSGIVMLPGFLQGKSGGQKQPIEGNFTVSSRDVSIIHDFYPELFVYKGNLKSKIRFSGTTKNPQLEARASILDLKAEYPEYGLVINLKNASLALKDHHLNILALLDSPDGTLKITGRGRVEPKDLDLFLKISGKDFRAVTTPYEKIFVSPKLFVFVKNNHIKTEGRLMVPRARIEGFSLSSSAIVPSADIKIEGEQDKGSGAAAKVYLDVNVVLGDEVKVKVYGLEGRLYGKIGLKTSPSGDLLGTGILSIKDGVYKAFETRLKIRKGRLIYFSSPLDNPELEVEAVRKVDDSLVGLRVTGRLKDPVIKLFSDPAMPESEIARYLLGGKEGKGVTKASAIAGGANLLLSRLRQRLGLLDEIKLETGQASDDLALMVGTYLRPDLYLKFINDFEDKVTRFILRYDYSKHIEIETETGESPSAGIFFKLER